MIFIINKHTCVYRRNRGLSRHLRIACAVIICLLVLSAGCSRQPGVISLAIDQECAEEFQNIITRYPPPFDYAVADPTLNPEAGKVLIRFEKQTWPEKSVHGNTPLLQKVLKCTWFAPTAFLWENKDNADSADLAAGIVVLPLDTITLPRKALSFENLYPPDAGYGLTEKIVLAVYPANNRLLPDQVLAWYRTIEEEDTPVITWLGGVGDVMPGEGAETLFLQQGIRGVFADTLPILQHFDLLAGNLEAAATSYDVKTPKSFNYRFQPAILGLLKEAGFDYFGLANNHCYDYGETGFRDTLLSLEQYKLPASGAGVTLDKAVIPWRTTVNGGEFTLLSLGAHARERNGFDGRTQSTVAPGRAGILWADDAGLKALAAACTTGAFDVVLVHGGKERTLIPTEEQQQLYRQFIDLGADLVLGSHPHALQGLEVYRNKLIAYSLGNFLFPDEVIYPYAKESIILGVGIAAQQIKYVKIYPVNMQGASVQLDKEERGLKRILELTRELQSTLSD